MKLSFIVPAYNEEHYLGKCLDSILKEIGANPGLEAEVVVVNNASTDNTKAVAQAFPNKIVDENRKGLVFARQAGAAVATGDLFAHIDSDCILPQGWIKKVVEEFSKDKKLVALSGPYIFYDQTQFQKIQVRLYYYLVYISYLFNRFIFRTNSMLQGGNIVVRSWGWNKIGTTSDTFSFYGEDAELARRLNIIGKVKFTFKLPMYTSNRRLAEEGIFTMAWRYSLNYLSVTYLKKPYTKNTRISG